MPSVKKGYRQQRKCKWCSSNVKEHYLKDGRFSGYYKTCGKKECLSEAYRDKNVRQTKRFHAERVCQSCKKPYEAKGRGQRWCKTCAPDKGSQAILRRYGVSKPQWDFLSKIQGEKCKLCNRKPKVVDHNHKTGDVRGLLCYGCNTLVGLLERDYDWIKKSLKYIKQNGTI